MDQARQKLREQVIGLGDEAKFDASRLKEFYGRIEDSLEQVSRELLEVMYDCVRKLSHKSHVYATLLGLIHNQGKQQLFVKDWFDKCFFGLQVALYTGNFADVTVLLKFFAELVSCKVLQDEEYFKTLNRILDLAFEEEAELLKTSSNNQDLLQHVGGESGPAAAAGRGSSAGDASSRSSTSSNYHGVQFPVYACLLSIAHLTKALQEKNEADIQAILEKVKDKIPRVKKLDCLLSPLQQQGGSSSSTAQHGSTTSIVQGDRVLELQSKLEFLYTTLVEKQHLAASPDPLRRPLIEYDKFKKAVPWGPLPIITAMKKASGKGGMLERMRHFQVPLWLPMQAVFDKERLMFHEIEGDAGHSEFGRTTEFQKAASEVAQFFAEEVYYLPVIQNFEEDLVLCVQNLLRMSLLGGSVQEDMVLVFTILKTALCSLPFPPLNATILYYKMLEILFELQAPCEEVFQDMVVRLLLLRDADLEIRDRLVELLGFHCSQGELETRSRILLKALDLCGRGTPEKPSQAEIFATNVLQQVVRMSFKKEVAAILDADRRRVLLNYLPHDVDVVNPFTVADWAKRPDACPPCGEYQKLHELIQIKAANPELLEKTFLKLIGTRKSARPDESGGKYRAFVQRGFAIDSSQQASAERWTKEELFDMLCYCFLAKGSKTPTHATKLMEIHRDVFAKFALPLRFIHVALDLWQHNPVRLELALEHLYIYKIAPAAMILGALPYERQKFAHWNVVSVLLRRILEALFFFYKQNEAPSAQSSFTEELKQCENSYEEAFLAVSRALAGVDSPFVEYGRDRYRILLRKFAGPRSSLALDFLPKIKEAQHTNWGEITEAAFLL
ncbi:unnamed protein product [Amoebophrya sp. A120]|nr:unnamed protein product [Amoebophrya sp. A120]|eukprot:GSA120T00017553001.1